MNDYYKDRLKDAEFSAKVIAICIILAGLLTSICMLFDL